MKLTILGSLVFLLTACGSTTSPAAPATSAPVSTATVAGTTATTVAAPAPATTKASTKPTTETVTRVSMPNAVGLVLQDAQDLMQKVTGNPVYFTHSHDLRFTRLQILDRDWKVCTQNVKQGKKFDPATTDIDFGVVKRGESCP